MHKCCFGQYFFNALKKVKAPARQGWCEGEGGSLMLTFYLWTIPIGQLAFAGNYHWFATMLLSLSSLAVMFTKWVIWVTYTHSTVQCTSLICIVCH